MKFMVYVNNEERLANGDEDTFESAVDEIIELLRSGHFYVEYVDEVTDDE
mgnify:CR=1 FL=1